MPKMQLITGKIALSGGTQTVIHRDQFNPLTPGEVMVLNLEHGQGACFDLFCIGEVERTVEEENTRLLERGYRAEYIKDAMPGVGHMQSVPMKLPAIEMKEPLPVPEPDIAGQKVILSNKILEMGGTPPPQNFPLHKFNHMLADLMEEAGVGQTAVEEPFEVTEEAYERVEKRILARKITEAGGEPPEMDADIDAFMEVLMGAKPEFDTEQPPAETGVVSDPETPKEERARLKREITDLGGKAPPNFSKVEKFREVLASLEKQAA